MPPAEHADHYFGLIEDLQRLFERPVDVLVMPDGSLLVSDDRADVIYRIWYRG
jgi:glucose/arabinose dehydrogenase